jgi:hypothetical protein
MKKTGLIIIALAAVISAYGEFRIWSDQKGNNLEAEFVGINGKNIVLKKQDGKKMELSPLLLSSDDQEYLYGKIPDELFDPSTSALDVEKPPRLEIDFKKITDTDNNLNSSSYRIIDMFSSVTITKKNSEPYSGQMKAEVYVIGIRERDNLLALLDKATHDFYFDARHKETTFQTDHITLREYRYNSNYSTEYEGYLVVVLDEEGKALAMKSSSKKFEENYQSLAKLRKGAFFNKRYTEEHHQQSGRYY